MRNEHIEQLKSHLHEGEALQRAAMAAEDWGAVVRLQRMMAVVYTALSLEPCVQG